MLYLDSSSAAQKQEQGEMCLALALSLLYLTVHLGRDCRSYRSRAPMLSFRTWVSTTRYLVVDAIEADRQSLLIAEDFTGSEAQNRLMVGAIQGPAQSDACLIYMSPLFLSRLECCRCQTKPPSVRHSRYCMGGPRTIGANIELL